MQLYRVLLLSIAVADSTTLASFSAATINDDASSESENSDVIRVQTDVYHKPYNQYHPDVANLLEMKLHLYDDPYDEATWFIELGSVQYAIAESIQDDSRRSDNEERHWDSEQEDVMNQNEIDSSDIVEKYLHQSINAYRSAVEIYNGIIELNDFMDESEKLQLEQQIATVIFDMGESYNLSFRTRHLALDYYVQSHGKFSNLVLQGKYYPDGNEVEDVELCIARCLVRIGNALIIKDDEKNNKTKQNRSSKQQDQPPIDPSFLPRTKGGGNVFPLTLDVQDILLGAGGGGGGGDFGFGIDEHNILLSVLEDPTKLEKLLKDQIDELFSSGSSDGSIGTGTFLSFYPNLVKAKEHFLEAVRIYRRYKLDYVETKHDDDDSIEEDLKRNKRHFLASSLQSLGMISMVENDKLAATDYYEESTLLNMNLVNNYMGKNDDDLIVMNEDTTVSETLSAISDAFYNLADIYLQQGRYDESKDRYRQSMEWNSKYNIRLPDELLQPKDSFSTDSSNTLAEYEKKLEEYQNQFGENSMDGGAGGGRIVDDEHGYFSQHNDWYRDDSRHLSERNDGYEGDLHASLGALYMTENDLVTAASHLTQAIRLYELAGEQNEQTMADTKLNLAKLYLRTDYFQASAQEYDEALDIYRQLFGDGVDPMSTSARLKGALEAAGLDESFLTDETMKGMLSDEISKALKGSKLTETMQHELQKMYGDSVHKQQQTKTTTTTTSKHTTNDSGSQPKSDNTHATKERLHVDTKGTSTKFMKGSVVLPDGTFIDLESYLQQNDTVNDE